MYWATCSKAYRLFLIYKKGSKINCECALAVLWTVGALFAVFFQFLRKLKMDLNV